MRTAIALLLLAGIANAANTKSATGYLNVTTPKVEVNGPHVHANEIIQGAADVDLGATPPVGSTRIIERSEIERAFAAANIPAPKKLPAAVRVMRRTKRLAATEVATAITKALGETKLPRGAVLANVRANSIEVPGDYKKVNVDLPPMPRRSGTATIGATVTFVGENDAPLHKTIVSLELVFPPEAAFADIQRGAAITLVVKKGLIEVSVAGTAATDGDIGSIVPVTLKPSGRVLRARVIDKDHAVAEES